MVCSGPSRWGSNSSKWRRRPRRPSCNAPSYIFCRRVVSRRNWLNGGGIPRLASPGRGLCDRPWAERRVCRWRANRCLAYCWWTWTLHVPNMGFRSRGRHLPGRFRRMPPWWRRRYWAGNRGLGSGGRPLQRLWLNGRSLEQPIRGHDAAPRSCRQLGTQFFGSCSLLGRLHLRDKPFQQCVETHERCAATSHTTINCCKFTHAPRGLSHRVSTMWRELGSERRQGPAITC